MSIRAKFNLKRGEFALDADLEVPSEGVTGLFGPSGSGKTTLLRAFAGLDRHPGGFLKIGESVLQEKELFVPTHKRPIGYVFQEPNLFPHLNVVQNIEYGRRRTVETSGGIDIDHVMSILNLGGFRTRMPETLSGGERQRVAIARALAVNPGLLLMDEPLASLDNANRLEILPYLDSLTSKLRIPTVYVSHDLEEIARLADHLVLLDCGTVKASGPVMDLLTRLDLPLSHGSGAEALIEALVSGHDEEFHMTILEFDGGRFTVPRKDLETGTTIRLRIFARDVSLTLERQSGTSIQNIFAAEVDDLFSEGDSQVTIRLKIGDGFFLALITRKSAAELDLRKGSKVFAQVKSVVLLD